MSTRHDEFDDLLRVLNEAGCLRHVLLVGSWAEYLYEATGVLEGFRCTIRTLDIDIPVRNQRLPSPPASITSVASRHGYIVDRDILTDSTKLRHPSGLEVEFLLGKVGAGMEPSLKTNIGVVAQTLHHLDILQREPLTVDYEGMTIGIPCPEAYVTQKMIVNDERGRKADKDAEAIKNLWPHLDKTRHVRIVSSLTRRERIRYDRYLERHTSNMVD